MSKSTDEQENLTDQLHQLEEYSSMLFKSDVASEEENHYCVLTASEVVTHMNDYVDSVNKIIMSTPTITRILLNHCKWDKSALLDKFCTDLDKLYEEAHVKDPSEFQNDSPTKKDCEICLLECESTTTINCGHSFCSSCWSEYLKTKIMDEGIATSISCAATGCEAIINDETVIQLVDDDEAKKRYERIIINSFVQKSPFWRWCPAPECSFVIQFYYTPYKPMPCRCKCDHEFCFVCGEEFHAPLTCELLRTFQKYLTERERTNEVRQRVKEKIFQEHEEIKNCPNPACNISIQKGFGCPAMKCKICLTYFCWYCLKSFKNEDGVYSHKCEGIPTWLNESNRKRYQRISPTRLSKSISRAKYRLSLIRPESDTSDETFSSSSGDSADKLPRMVHFSKLYHESVKDLIASFDDESEQSTSNATGEEVGESSSEGLSEAEKKSLVDDSEQRILKEISEEVDESSSKDLCEAEKKGSVDDSEQSIFKEIGKIPGESSSEGLSEVEKKNLVDESEQTTLKETGKELGESSSEGLNKNKKRLVDDSEQSTFKEIGKELGESSSEGLSKNKKRLVDDSEQSASKETGKKLDKLSSEGLSKKMKRLIDDYARNVSKEFGELSSQGLSKNKKHLVDDSEQSTFKEIDKRLGQSSFDELSEAEKKGLDDDSGQSTSKEICKKLDELSTEGLSKEKKHIVDESEQSTSKKTGETLSEGSSEDSESPFAVINLEDEEDDMSDRDNGDSNDRKRLSTGRYFRKYQMEESYLRDIIKKYAFIKSIISTLSDDSPTLEKLKLASRDLIRCQRIIKYTAIFAIYLKTVHQPLIFKSLFCDLKDATAQLNFYMEKIQLYENDHHPNIPNELFTVHRNCQLRYKALVDFVDNGYDNGLWTFKSKVEI